ncbi:hypothetical protein GCM10027341_42970 [Spirosoma knui]
MVKMPLVQTLRTKVANEKRCIAEDPNGQQFRMVKDTQGKRNGHSAVIDPIKFKGT